MKDRPSLAVFTEASRKIGTGHLMESLNLVKSARKNGMDVELWVSRSSPGPLLDKIPFSYGIFSDVHGVVNVLKAKKFDVAVFNLRRINNSALRNLPGTGLKTLCIDELGGRTLDCDAIVNPLIVSKYRRYPASGRKARLYAGADYLAISPKFTEANDRRRDFKGVIREVSVSMGGADRSGATLNIIDALSGWRKEVRKNIILGAAFPFFFQLKKSEKVLGSLNFKIYRNVKNVVPLFLKSDVVFTAGGNTLYELACLGVPAVVLYEDEHERENGLAFQRRGFGICLGKGASVKKERILSELNKFDDPVVRNRHSIKGRELVDGRGAERILRIIKGLSRQ